MDSFHTLANLVHDNVFAEEHIEFCELAQSVERLVCVLEVEGRVRSIGILEDIEVGILLVFLCPPTNTCSK